MKKLIAGAALVSTILGSGAYALADNGATATSQSTASAAATSQGGSTSASAQSDATVQANSNLPQVTLTPDKLLYVLKMWAEKIQLVVTTDAAGKAALLETQAQSRLAEARAMAQAGKQDLAQAALLDAKAKLEAAQKAIEAAAKTNKDMSKLTSRIEADEISFAGALTAMLDKAPDSVRAEFQPVAAELLAQMAANHDAVKQDDAVAKQDDAVAKQAAKAAPAAPAAPAPSAATQANLEAAVEAQVNTAAPATQAPAPASKASAKVAAKAAHETDKVEKVATKAATKVERAAAKAETDDDDREEADDAVKVEASSTTRIGFPLVNVKMHGEHGRKGGH